MTDTSSSASLTHNGISYALYEGKACGDAALIIGVAKN